MCDHQSLRSPCAYTQSDLRLSWSLKYSMTVDLLTEHHFEFISLKGGASQARLSLHLSKCHINGNHMSRLKYNIFWLGLILYIPVNSYGHVRTLSSPNHTFFWESS